MKIKTQPATAACADCYHRQCDTIRRMAPRCMRCHEPIKPKRKYLYTERLGDSIACLPCARKDPTLRAELRLARMLEPDSSGKGAHKRRDKNTRDRPTRANGWYQV